MQVTSLKLLSCTVVELECPGSNFDRVKVDTRAHIRKFGKAAHTSNDTKRPVSLGYHLNDRQAREVNSYRYFLVLEEFDLMVQSTKRLRVLVGESGFGFNPSKTFQFKIILFRFKYKM